MKCQFFNDVETGQFTAQKMKFSIKDFFSICVTKSRICSLLLIKSLVGNFIFGTVVDLLDVNYFTGHYMMRKLTLNSLIT